MYINAPVVTFRDALGINILLLNFEASNPFLGSPELRNCKVE
jgi:hypothetical protein